MGTPVELQLVADGLFKRQRLDHAPSDKYWCLSAIDNYADKFSGPWFRYGDELWQCELCNTDPYLSEYGEKYLLGGAGMLAIIDKMGDQLCWEFLKSEDKWYAWCSNNDMKASGAGETLPAAVIDCAIAAIPMLCPV